MTERAGSSPSPVSEFALLGLGLGLSLETPSSSASLRVQFPRATLLAAAYLLFLSNHFPGPSHLSEARRSSASSSTISTFIAGLLFAAVPMDGRFAIKVFHDVVLAMQSYSHKYARRPLANGKPPSRRRSAECHYANPIWHYTRSMKNAQAIPGMRPTPSGSESGNLPDQHRPVERPPNTPS